MIRHADVLTEEGSCDWEHPEREVTPLVVDPSSVLARE